MTDALFDVGTAQVPRARRTPPGTGRVTWGKYRPKEPVKCDDCMSILAAASGKAPVARTARWRRRQGDADRLLCGGHMEQRRHEEGLTPLKDDRKDKFR